jgi:hypothetical protein
MVIQISKLIELFTRDAHLHSSVQYLCRSTCSLARIFLCKHNELDWIVTMASNEASGMCAYVHAVYILQILPATTETAQFRRNPSK